MMSTPIRTTRSNLYFEITAKGVAILLLIFLVTACGSESEEMDEDGISYDQTTAEGAAYLMVEEMRDADFTCASPLYFGEALIMEYFGESTLGPQGTIGVCTKLKQDAQTGMYTSIQNAVAPFDRFEVEAEGEMPGTQPGMVLPYVEGTAYSEDETIRAHVNRMVQHDGKWYVLVLMSYPRFY